jgi:dihydroflavonol-4-reductase
VGSVGVLAIGSSTEVVSDPTTKSLLVTGGAGFLGSRVVRSYLDRGIPVRAVGHLTRGSYDHRNLPAGLELIDRELCDLESILEMFADQDLVIHTAARLHAHTLNERVIQRKVNVEATRNIIEACRRQAVPRLLHVSSSAAIGISIGPGAPADETFPFNLDHLGLSYNVTKHQAEQLVLEANGPDLETVVVNPGFMFGRHQGGYRGGAVIERVLRRPVVVCTDGGMSLVHVDDVVDGVRRVADYGRPGERYILSGENLSFHEIARTVSRVSGKRKIVISIPTPLRDLAGVLLNSSFAQHRGLAPPLHLRRQYAYQFYSSEKARLEVGYDPRSFESIVADSLDSREP